MKKLFKPASIAFYFLMLIVFFIIGIYIAGFVGAGKNQMLAGGAIVLGWGVLFAAIAFFSSFFISYYMQHRSIVRINWILLVLLVLLYGITHYRYIERQKEKEKEKPKIEQPQRKTTKPISFEPVSIQYEKIAYKKSSIDIKTGTVQVSDSKMGIGFFSPQLLEHYSLYFYDSINLEKGLTDHSPQDSVVLTRDQNNNPTISYAPPWLYPEHLKLDYGIMIFKILGVGLNPCCKMCGIMLEDEGVISTCHIGIGTSITLGGTIKSTIHYDLLMWDPKIEVDGKIILDGRIALV